MLKIKYTKGAFYLSALLLLSAMVWAQKKEEKEIQLKHKLAAPLTPPVAQQSQAATIVQKNAESQLGVPVGFRVKGVEEKAVTLSWRNTEITNGLWEDFEMHDDFVINSGGEIGWKYVDMDQKLTYTVGSAVYPNAGNRMAFIVFNPSATSPALQNPEFGAYSGQKYLAAFAVDGKNNDWIISPELKFSEPFQFSFRAKSFTDKYGLERIRVGYSTTGTNLTDFIFISKDDYEEVLAAWTLKSYEIPADAKYVTINCVSEDAFVLMLDDFFIGTNIIRPKAPDNTPKLTGFNLYRDGKKLNSEPVTEMHYIDSVPDYIHYEYTISALFSDGNELFSEEKVNVEIPDIRLLPFYDSFDNWNLTDQKWERPEGDASYWKINYYEIGLVNPSLCYQYSRLLNYSQSVVSRELRTLQPTNTYLRLDVKKINFNHTRQDTLSIEIADAADGFTQWREVGFLENELGTFPWVTYTYNLSTLLNDPLFRIRLRAHGTNAYDIDYWYVDNIKVWNPEWSSLSLNVRSAGNILEGAAVELSDQKGGDYSGVTNSEGVFAIAPIEAGNYQLKVLKTGYNESVSTISVMPDQPFQMDIDLQQPLLQSDRSTLSLSLKQEQKQVEKVTLTNSGTGEAVWKLQPQYPARMGNEAVRFTNPRSFRASGDLQTGVVFDGEYYYTASWYFLGIFYKYDKAGNYLEEFPVKEMYYRAYDLAYDGRYVYTSNKTNILYQIDLKTRQKVAEIRVGELPDLKITHCSYDPRNDQFWIGEYNNICRIDRSGKVQIGLKTISDEIALSVSGTGFDNYTPGGPYLWLSCEEAAPTTSNKYNMACIRQFRINTMKLTGTIIDLSNLPGFVEGNTNSGPVYAAGMETTLELEPGILSAVGIMQQSPSTLYSFPLCSMKNGIEVSPLQGTLAPGESCELSVVMNARDAALSATYETKYKVVTIPEVNTSELVFNYTVSGKADYPRPVEFTATVKDDKEVNLAWKPGDGANNPTGYRVYRNGLLITNEPLVTTSYTDADLLAGDYTYQVTALYGDQTSLESDRYDVNIRVGRRCYAPIEVVSSVSGNRYIDLSWKNPYKLLNETKQLKWDTGVNDEMLGLTEGGLMYAGVLWKYSDLQYYQYMQIESVNFLLKEYVNNLYVQIYRDGKAIHSQPIAVDGLSYGEYFTVPLNAKIVVEPGCDYMIVLRIIHEPGRRPLGMDLGPTVEGKGNWLSEDGKNWSRATDLGALDGNFNIGMTLLPNENADYPVLKGYNVYRDGTKLNEDVITETTFRDEPKAAGDYRYTLSSVYESGESAQSAPVKGSLYTIAGYHKPANLAADLIYNRFVELAWGYPVVGSTWINLLPNPQIAQQTEREPLVLLHQFETNEKSESGVASDGTYLYTSSWVTSGKFSKYTLDGQFLESFVIPGVGTIRDLTFDGTFFYGGEAKSAIYQMDFASKSLVSKFSISELARHCAYIPELDNGKGGFETGDWQSSIFVNKRGAKIGDGPRYDHAFGTAYHDGMIYAFEQGDGDAIRLRIYDMNTHKALRDIDLSKYPAFSSLTGALAGGVTVVTSDEGVSFLVAVLQTMPKNRIAIFQLEDVRGVAGYHVYRNGQRITEQPAANRYFSLIEEEAGSYEYQIRTLYVDGSESEFSEKQLLEVLPKGDCTPNVTPRAYQTANGHDFMITWNESLGMEPEYWVDAESGAPFALFEQAGWGNIDLSGTPTVAWVNYAFDEMTQPGAWRNFNGNALQPALYRMGYEGEQTLLSMPAAQGETMHCLVSPELNYTTPFDLSFAAALFNQFDGDGVLRIFTSTGSNDFSDLQFYREITPSEEWAVYNYRFDPTVKYVAICHAGVGGSAILIDRVALSATPVEAEIYAFDLFRDGKQLNTQPIKANSFRDSNLLPGNYSYQLRYHTTRGCVTPLSDPLDVALSYEGTCEAPMALKVQETETGVRLQWNAPAISDKVYLKWHSGANWDAAGLPSGGGYYAGVLWDTNDLKNYHSLSISEVDVYVQNPPDAMFLLIYEGNTLMYQQYVPKVNQYTFNTIALERPYRIPTDKNLRVAIYVEHNQISVPLGFDAGPAVYGKGDCYSDDGVSWSTLTDNQMDGNWNITVGLRAFPESEIPAIRPVAVADFMTTPNKTGAAQSLKSVRNSVERVSSKNQFGGYYVYRDGVRLNELPITTTSYLDTPEENGNHTYYVTAVYSECGEIASETVTYVSTGIYSDFQQVPDIRRVGKVIHITGVLPADRIEVTTLQGVRIYEETIRDIQTSVNLTDCATGVYLVRILRADAQLLIRKVSLK